MNRYYIELVEAYPILKEEFGCELDLTTLGLMLQKFEQLEKEANEDVQKVDEIDEAIYL